MLHMNRWISLVCAAMLLFVVPVRAQVLGANDQPIHDAARIGNGNDVTVILKVQPAARDAKTPSPGCQRNPSAQTVPRGAA